MSAKKLVKGFYVYIKSSYLQAYSIVAADTDKRIDVIKKKGEKLRIRIAPGDNMSDFYARVARVMGRSPL